MATHEAVEAEPQSAALPEAPSDDTPAAGTGSRFPVEVEGFSGSLEQLVIRAQRGEVDLADVPVAAITAGYRRSLSGGNSPEELRALADFMALASRLVALKAQALMPSDDATALLEEETLDPSTEAGRRLAEYRLYRAAADALLAEPTEEGARSFLALVTPEVLPVERLRIPPERLAAAFRSVLERLAASQRAEITTHTYSVEELTARLRTRLAAARTMTFDAVFADVSNRLEAVALFLALLEMLRTGDAVVEQAEPFAPIQVNISA